MCYGLKVGVLSLYEYLTIRSIFKFFFFFGFVVKAIYRIVLLLGPKNNANGWRRQVRRNLSLSLSVDK